MIISTQNLIKNKIISTLYDWSISTLFLDSCRRIFSGGWVLTSFKLVLHDLPSIEGFFLSLPINSYVYNAGQFKEKNKSRTLFV